MDVVQLRSADVAGVGGLFLFLSFMTATILNYILLFYAFPFCLKFDSISFAEAMVSQSSVMSKEGSSSCSCYRSGLWQWFLNMCHQRPRSSLRPATTAAGFPDYFLLAGWKKNLPISGGRVWLEWKCQYSQVLMERAPGRAWFMSEMSPD